MLQPNNYRLNDWLNRLLCQREKLLLFNQKYWGSYRRKEWLVNGDQNSRFFQQRANNRRKKKLVCKLNDDCGLWIDNPQAVAEKFVNDYKTRYLSAGHLDGQIPDPQLPSRISYSDNLSLIRITDISEIKSALFFHRLFQNTRA